MTDYRDWTGPEAGWIKEGHYISYARQGTRYYEHVVGRDIAHYEYEWFETIDAGEESGPQVPTDLIVTKGYDAETTLNHVWQVLFGIKGQVYIYVELPTDIHRHGVPKKPKPSLALRAVSHFQEYMSPYHDPSFITEHIMMKPGYDRINLSAYNPNAIDMTDVKLNFFISRMITERVGTERYGRYNTVTVRNDAELTALMNAKWQETLEKLWKRQIPCRPLTLEPVRAPEAEE